VRIETVAENMGVDAEEGCTRAKARVRIETTGVVGSKVGYPVALGRKLE